MLRAAITWPAAYRADALGTGPEPARGGGRGRGGGGGGGWAFTRILRRRRPAWSRLRRHREARRYIDEVDALSPRRRSLHAIRPRSARRCVVGFQISEGVLHACEEVLQHRLHRVDPLVVAQGHL